MNVTSECSNCVLNFTCCKKPDNLVKRMVKTLRKSPSEERRDDWVNIMTTDLIAKTFCMLIFDCILWMCYFNLHCTRWKWFFKSNFCVLTPYGIYLFRYMNQL